MTDTFFENQILLPNAPPIPKLVFRGLRSEADYGSIVEVANACAMVDDLDNIMTVEWAINFFSHLNNFDPRRDLLLAEIDGEVVAFNRLWLRELDDGARACFSTGCVQPRWRRRGLGRAMLHQAERRLREKAAESSSVGRRNYRSFAANTEHGATALLLSEGYQPVRYGFQMIRPLDEAIPDLPLPAGLEVRAVQPEHYRQVTAALNEAFRDHWGHSEATEEDYQRWLNDPDLQPHLWQVAWDGDEVAGLVLNTINAEENAALKRRYGWTDPICVRRPWRRRGLARALIARSLRLLKEQGMTTATLDVDTQNPNGALQLYRSLGYRVAKQFATYEKPMD